MMTNTLIPFSPPIKKSPVVAYRASSIELYFFSRVRLSDPNHLSELIYLARTSPMSSIYLKYMTLLVKSQLFTQFHAAYWICFRNCISYSFIFTDPESSSGWRFFLLRRIRSLSLSKGACSQRSIGTSRARLTLRCGYSDRVAVQVVCLAKMCRSLRLSKGTCLQRDTGFSLG